MLKMDIHTYSQLYKQYKRSDRDGEYISESTSGQMGKE